MCRTLCWWLFVSVVIAPVLFLVSRIMHVVRYKGLISVLTTSMLWSAAMPGVSHAQKVKPLIGGGNVVLDVSPASGSTTAAGNSSSQTYVFYVENTGTANGTGTFSIGSCTGAVSSCTVSPTSASVSHGGSVPVTVTFHTAATGTGGIDLSVSWPTANYIDGYVAVTLPGAQPSVTASPTTVWTQQNVSTGYPYFTIKNTGITAAAYTLTASCTNIANGDCYVPSPSVSVAPNSTTTAELYFTTGPASGGNATIKLTATSPYSETSSQTVTIVPMSEYVSVGGQIAPTPPNPSGSATYGFTITATGNNTSSVAYGLTASCSGALNCSTSSPGSVSIAPGSPGSATVLATAASDKAGGTGTVTLTALYTDPWGNPYSGQYAYTVLVPDVRTYNVAVTPTSFDDYTAENVPTNYGFTVTNNGNTGATYTLNASCTGGETSCASRDSSLYVGASSSATEYVDFHTGAAGSTGYVSLLASGPSNSSTGQIHVIPLSEAVSVSAGTSTTTVTQGSPQALGFTVNAVGNYMNPITYTLSTACTGAVTCPSLPTPSSVTITPGSPASSSVVVSASSNPAGGTGTASLTASYTNSWGQLYQASAATTATVPDTRNDSVIVTPKSDSVTYDSPNTSTSYGFKVRNAGNDTATYNLSIAACTGTQTGTGGCTFATGGSTITVNPGQTGTAVVYFTTGAPNQIVTAGLHATATVNGHVYADDGSVEIIPATHGAPVIDISKANSGESVTRDRCLTVFVGKGAAYNCGDLRFAHAFPTIQTYNEARTPALIYNSQHAAPHPIISADVTLPVDTVLPPTVSASLTVGGVSRATTSWNGSAWSTPGTSRRVAMTFDASGLATGVYPYTLTITSNFTSAPLSSSASGSLIIVNRSANAGWWIAGVEQLFFPADTATRLWVGGDGSARLYHWASAGVWKAESVDRPDSLTLSGSTYTRWDEHRLQVQFDMYGRHVATVTRLGHTTTFGYDGALLTSITVPGASSSYALSYTGSALDSVKSLNRKLSLTRGSTSLTFTDPDGSTVRYDYLSSTALINKRTDELGNATSYQFDSVSNTLAQVSVAMQSPAPAIVTTFRAAEGAALGGPVSSDSVYTLVNGPRKDTTITKVWIDRFGEPTRIINALGGSTLLQRSDWRFPALVTQMTDPTGFVTSASYDSHGNDSTVTRHNPLGDGMNPTTSYTWNQKFDFLSGITQPTGETMTMVYDSTTGNRTSQYPGTSATRAVQFFYDPTTKNLSASELPGTTARDSIAYDSLGNVRFTRTPLGHQTTFTRDAVGRIIQTTGPLDTLGNRHVYTSVQYDMMGRDTLSLTYSDSTFYSASDSLYTHKAYDAEGNLLSVKNESHPLVGTIGTIKTVTTYDALDRETAEYTIGSAGDTVTVKRFTYDAAGNRTNGGGDGGADLTVSFDALNRQVVRKSLDDSAAYSYDAAGRLLTANNRYAQIARGYYPGGALKADTLRIAVTDTTVGVPTRFASHVYRDSVTYDASERRSKLVYPDNTTASYTYDPVFGNISSIVGPGGEMYSMQYDLSGRLMEQGRRSGTADSVYASIGYDNDSRLARDSVIGAGTYGTTWQIESMQYDARDKVLSATSSIAPEAFTYSPLGAVTEGNTMSGATEEFTVDALGNSYMHELNGVTSSYLYHAGTTRLDMMLTPNGIYTDTTEYAYDKDGNRLDETTSHYLSDPTPGFTNDCAPVGDAVCINTAKSYTYNGENLLERTYVMIDSTVTHPPYYPYTTDEHFRYDALGRRVWARMNHSANCDKQKPWGGCYNTLLRSMWDGDQLIYEIQVPADSTASLETDSPSESGSYGIVSYVHGAGLDAPLAIYKGGSLAVLPFVNYRGVVDVVACPGPSYCPDVPVPGLTDGLNHLDGGTTSGPTGFYGTLQSGGKTGSGLVYQRNRYVDPQTGKFTQADPIGLAGGVNAWGFVGGDPVSYSDPFGLCPGFGDVIPCEAALASIGAVGGAVIGGTIGAAGGTLVFPGVGTIAGAAGVGLAGAGFGATVGGFIGKVADVLAAHGRTASGGYTDEHGNELGPSGKPKIHEVDSPTRKGAKDAARSAGKGTPVEHPNPTRGNPHFHPTGADGEKIPSSPHYTYPQ